MVPVQIFESVCHLCNKPFMIGLLPGEIVPARCFECAFVEDMVDVLMPLDYPNPTRQEDKKDEASPL